MKLVIGLLVLFSSAAFAQFDGESFDADMRSKGYSIQGCTLISIGIDQHSRSLFTLNLKNAPVFVFPKQKSQKIMFLDGGSYHTLDIDWQDPNPSQGVKGTIIEILETTYECTK
ncbi:TPA: hypothetical protein ACPVY9_000983 [Vibrio parahaemolyticus]